jgi:hypothetical protein
MNIKDECFDHIIDNSILTLDQTNDKLVEFFRNVDGILPEIEVLG